MGQYLAKIWTKVWWHVFLTHSVHACDCHYYQKDLVNSTVSFENELVPLNGRIVNLVNSTVSFENELVPLNGRIVVWSKNKFIKNAALALARFQFLSPNRSKSGQNLSSGNWYIPTYHWYWYIPTYHCTVTHCNALIWPLITNTAIFVSQHRQSQQKEITSYKLILHNRKKTKKIYITASDQRMHEPNFIPWLVLTVQWATNHNHHRCKYFQWHGTLLYTVSEAYDLTTLYYYCYYYYY